jgi:outer membrane lipoprotein LolB
MIYKRFLKIVGLASFLLLSGCANIEGLHESRHFQVKSPAVRQAELSKIKSWQINGAFSIDQAGRQHAEIAYFDWHQINPKNYHIDISSALNLYSMSIYREYGTVKLWKNGVNVSTAKTPEGLMEKAVGWSLPIREMNYWIKGVPAENAGNYQTRFNRYGQLMMLQQEGWMVYYNKYRRNAYGIDLPHVVIMQRPGLSAKIVIKEWVLLNQHERMMNAIM